MYCIADNIEESLATKHSVETALGRANNDETNCKKYNYLEANGVVVGKNDVLRGSVRCYSNCYNYYMVYTYYILNVNNMVTSIYNNCGSDLL